MKKLILPVAILAVAASCSKTEVTDIAPSLQNEISFSTLNDRVVSKAANDASDKYIVYAADAGQTTGSEVWRISALEVTTGSDGKDTWTGNYYYPVGGETDVNFLAYAPSTVTAVAVKTATASEAVPYITFTDYVVGGAEDFTVACESQEKGTVALEFEHMLSKVDIKVVLDGATLSGYSLTASSAKATLGVNLDKNTATLDNTNGGVWGNSPALDGEGTSRSYSSNLTAVTEEVEDDGTGETSTETVDNEFESSSIMILPQAGKDCTIALSGLIITDPAENVVIGGTSGKALGTYTLAGDEDGLTDPDSDTDYDDYEFVKGTYYTITITITSDAKDGDGNDLFGTAISISSNHSWTSADVSLDEDNQPEA